MGRIKRLVKTVRVFEAFSGYGAQSLALKYLGIPYDSVGISEIDIEAIIAYGVLRYSHVPFDYPSIDIMRARLMDYDVGYDFAKDKSRIPRLSIKKLNLVYKYHILSGNRGNITKVHSMPEHDLFTYSFPCQDISVCGAQEGLDKSSGSRSSLLWECERLIEWARPKVLMLENVKNLVGKRHKPHFDAWLAILDKLGYNNYWKVVNAKCCGIPQSRERVFVVSIRKDIDDGSFKFEEDFDNGLRLKDLLEEEVAEKYYLSDAIAFKYKHKPIGDNVLGTTKGNKCTRIGTRDVVYNVNKCMGALLKTDYKHPKQILVRRATRQKRHNSVAPNIDVVGTVELKGHDINKRVYSKQGISATLPTGQSGNTIPKLISDSAIRKLTPRECFRLMGVKDEDIDFIQNTGVSNTQQYKLAGNSIVTNQITFLKNINWRKLLRSPKAISS